MPHTAKTAEEKLTTLRTDILTGVYDEHEDEIYRLLKERRGIAASFRKAELQIGDVVTLHNLRPKAINGLRLRIDEILKTRVSGRIIEEDRNRAPARAHGTIRVPITNIEQTEGAA